MLRHNLLFIHVISAIGMFAALGMEAIALAQLRRAPDSAIARMALSSFGSSQRLHGASALVLLLSGLYLATAYYRWQGAWMGLGLLALIAVGAVGGLMTNRRVRRLQERLGEDESGTTWIETLPALRTSFAIRTVLLTGVVYLMTVKP